MANKVRDGEAQTTDPYTPAYNKDKDKFREHIELIHEQSLEIAEFRQYAAVGPFRNLDQAKDKLWGYDRGEVHKLKK